VLPSVSTQCVPSAFNNDSAFGSTTDEEDEDEIEDSDEIDEDDTDDSDDTDEDDIDDSDDADEDMLLCELLDAPAKPGLLDEPQAARVSEAPSTINDGHRAAVEKDSFGMVFPLLDVFFREFMIRCSRGYSKMRLKK